MKITGEMSIDYKPYYKGNTELKKKGVQIEFTPEQVGEIVKCYQDIKYFLANYVYIISLDKGKVLFDLYDFQEEMIYEFQRNRFTIATLSRQMGKTITVCAFLLYQAIFNNDYFIAILANNAAKSREILGRLKMMYELLPWWLKPGVVEWNKGSVEFSNGSKIFAGPTTNSSIRGFSINCVYLDEFAFVQNDVEFFTSTYPVITSGKQTKIIITSTPNGMNLFYKLYTDAVNRKNEFKAIKYIWNRHPHRDEEWKRETIRNTSEKQFRQEHHCEFLGSSNTLISGECLERLTFIDPVYSDEYNNLYEKPKPGNTYVCFVDVGEGAGRDFSVINVIDITEKPYRQVYIYRRNDLSPWLLTPVLVEIATKYNQAYIQVENNSVGKIVADTLFYEYDYENTISSKIFKGEEKFAEYTTHGLGVRMDKRSKVMGCSALKTLLEENVLIINDWTTIQEMSWFVKNKTSYEAEKGKTDDIAMTLVHFGWLSIQTFFEDLSKPGIYEIMREIDQKNEDQRVTAFGFFSDGTEDYEFSYTRM